MSENRELFKDSNNNITQQTKEISLNVVRTTLRVSVEMLWKTHNKNKSCVSTCMTQA